MKHVLYMTAAVAVFATPAFAQVFTPSSSNDNSANVEQIGNGNNARINQTAGGLLNGQHLGEVLQNGDSNDGRIAQRSLSGSVSGAFDNDATIDQRRDLGDARIIQVHDYGTTDTNSALILQVTDSAFARVRQRGDANTANVRQRAASTTPRAIVEQNGSDNRANVNQRGDSSVVRIFQGENFGAGAGLSPETDNARASVNNNGDFADIKITQLDFRNRTTVLEDGVNNVINVRQEGNFNEADITQTGSDGMIDVQSTASAFDNRTTLIQSDSGSTILIVQEGERGTADVEQLGAGDNLADVNQSGLGSSFGDVLSTILQDGGTNTATVSQTANFANSDILQVGTSHTATVNQ